MYNFFVPDNQIKNNIAEIKGNDYNHIKNVLRMKNGENIYISNKETGERFLANIDCIDKESIVCNIIEKIDSSESKVKISLYQGIPKSDKMEYIIQKSVELGVYNIIPVNMKYCVAKINNEGKKIDRWQAIAEAAAKQSKRNIIPKIEGKKDFKQIINELNEYDLSIIAYENEDNINLKQVLQKNKEIKNIAIIIGPEGGLHEKEVEMLIDNGAKSVTIGKRILRTETASLAMLSMIMYEYEF